MTFYPLKNRNRPSIVEDAYMAISNFWLTTFDRLGQKRAERKQRRELVASKMTRGEFAQMFFPIPANPSQSHVDWQRERMRDVYGDNA